MKNIILITVLTTWIVITLNRNSHLTANSDPKLFILSVITMFTILILLIETYSKKKK